MATFEIYKDKAQEFRFRLVSEEENLLASEGYQTKSACLNGIKSVKKHCKVDKQFDRLKSKNGKPYFNLKAFNQRIIGTSGSYKSKKAMEKGIEEIKNLAEDADTVDIIT